MRMIRKPSRWGNFKYVAHQKWVQSSRPTYASSNGCIYPFRLTLFATSNYELISEIQFNIIYLYIYTCIPINNQAVKDLSRFENFIILFSNDNAKRNLIM